METHMPYAPPDAFVQKFVPYFHETPEAQHFIREFNRKAMQWLIPLPEPFSELESKTLSDMYDAEVAYQDHLLAQLLSALDTKYHRENTMVIFLADHGEMLGEHGYMGHGFGVHEELVRVPLFMRYPDLSGSQVVDQRVSITQLFYTIMDYFGFDTLSMPYAEEVDVRCRSLLQMTSREYCGPRHVISEAYAPENALSIMRNHLPGLIDQYRAEVTQRAVYEDTEKMLEIEGFSKVLYDLVGDPFEEDPYQNEAKIKKLSQILDTYLEVSETHRASSQKRKISLKDDIIQQRLRDLGYIE